MKIAIAGCGYVGLVTGACLAQKGFDVICIDTDNQKIDQLSKGLCPIYEPGLEQLINENKNHLSFTCNYQLAYKDADIIFIAVGTPEKSDGSANLSYIYEVARQISDSISKDCVVAIKSTVPVGTGDKIEALFKKTIKQDINVYVAANPEFLSQASAVDDTLNASRIVIGANNHYAEKALLNIYESFNSPKVVTNRVSAEMIKYASNDFLALKISYINEIANLCEITGANIDHVAKGMGLDNRIGDKFLRAGIGYGGSCFPKDTKALHWLANYHDIEIKTIKAAIEVNEKQKLRLIKKAKKYYPNFDGISVSILGLTFKPGTDDLREAPSLINIPVLLEDGANIRVWDPAGMEKFKKLFDNASITYCSTIEEAIRNTDLCLIFTDWPQIVGFDITKFKELMNKPVLLDGRNCFDPSVFINAGIIYDSIGR